ncbi:unnamed protein product [Phaedon cochleariae]|uniref:Uncharacterized protein n=1 Tax=Phaedon cochleariae TaxID=80249 RepID=A0A9N9SEU9_PHACE|nr:unnamed protein product [Phaedon cochleariae]
MESTNKEEDFTVQGLGTPVPVGSRGEMAGHTRSSTSDCKDTNVEIQAGFDSPASSQDVYAFNKSQKISRSPIRKIAREVAQGTSEGRKRVNALTGHIFLNAQARDSDEEQAREKRKRETTPVKSEKEKAESTRNAEKEYNALKDIAKRMAEELEMVKSVITEIPNTKKEIKNAIKKLDGYVNRMPKALGVMAEVVEGLKTEGRIDKREKPEVRPQTQMQKQSPNKTREIGTQTTEWSEEKSTILMRIGDGLRNEIKEEEVEEVIDLSWPEDAFERCRRSIETELIGEERSVIIITKEGEKETNNFIKKATERNLQISRIVEQEKLEAGKMVGTKTVSEMMAEKEGFEEALIRYTYIISTNGAKAGIDRISLRDNLRNIAEITKTCGHSEIACVVTKQVDGTSTRKCLEWVGREQDMNWVLYKGVDQKTEWEGARKRREEDVIILKPADGTSYAQLVKSMEDTVDTEGITIDKINKTNNGNVQIKIKGKEEKSRSLFRATLTKKLEGVANIHFKQKTQTFMILDIDETVEEEEVRRVLSKETNSGHSEEMRMKLSEKINDRGLKYAFITLGEDSAKLIENRRRIGNGWNRWRIKKVDEVKKCYRSQKISRSPIRKIAREVAQGTSEGRKRVNSLTSHIFLNAQARDSDEEQAREKRKRETTPVKSEKEKAESTRNAEKEYNALKDIAKRMAEELEMVKSVITEIPNTKKEIKNAIKKLDGYVNRMPKALGVMAEVIEGLKTEGRIEKREKPEVRPQTQMQKQSPNKTREIGTQTTEWKDAFERCRRSIETELIGEERSVIIITKEGEKDTDNFIKKATERNLQISRIVEQEKLEAGKMVGTKTVSEMMAEKGGFEEALIRYTYIISTNGAKAGTDRISLRDNLRKIAEITKTCGHSEIACVVTKQVDGTSTRKCLEWVGREQDVNWVLYKGVDQKTEWKGARKRREEDVIILKPADGTSYAQLVKSMKDTVDTEGITIDKINKTNNGNVQIKIKGKEEKSRSLFRATLTEKLEGVAKIHFKQKTQTFMILDIDETVEEEEVRRVLSKETNSGHSEEMRMKLSEKINDRGLKYAFITLGEDSAKLIENRRRIGNGWNRWRMKKVDEVKKCYRYILLNMLNILHLVQIKSKKNYESGTETSLILDHVHLGATMLCRLVAVDEEVLKVVGRISHYDLL